ncbi:MAG: hypothetical protein R3B54_07620 [Bdellovibrionota bacterium]
MNPAPFITCELLRSFTKFCGKSFPSDASEAYMLTGMAYESIDELKLWSLPEVYYQSCIRTYPHSTQAERCYTRFEENIYAGYTGSSGTHLPSDVRTKLQTLREEAQKRPNQLAISLR